MEKELKIGFIGCGNVATALIGGILQSGYAPADILASDRIPSVRENKSAELGVRVISDNTEVVSFADVIFLCVKPQFYQEMLEEIRESSIDKLFVSLAPGKTIEYVQSQLSVSSKIVRIMPNTPALVGEGMIAVTPGKGVSDEETELVMSLLSACGRAEQVPEHLMDVVTAVSGSSPAYVFLFIEALADAAVLGGMPRAQAYSFVAQAVRGSATLMLETGRHPGELKDMVCSPAGTTIEAVRVLEEKGLRSVIIEAAIACMEKASKL